MKIGLFYFNGLDNVIMDNNNLDKQAIRNIIAEQLNNNLLNYEDGLQYLNSRGITSETISKASLGYCPPYFNHYQYGQIALSPLLKGRITLPIKDSYGNIVAFAGRKLENLTKSVEAAFWSAYQQTPAEAQNKVDQWKRGKWINESFPKKFHLYNLNLAKPKMRELDYVFLVEGYFDSLTLNSFGLINNVALCGTRLTDWHASKLSRYCTTAIALLDGDDAGRKALEHIETTLSDFNMKLKIINLPEGQDPDTFLLEHGNKNILAAVNLMLQENEDEEIFEVSF
jgi:DNA primase